MDDANVAIRLKLFLDFVGLSSSHFADKCGIPRPTFSQLLSGRNKKLSDQIVKPIHDTFPELSVLWLMFGEGDMLVSAPQSVSDEPTNDEIADDAPINLAFDTEPEPVYGRPYSLSPTNNSQAASISYGRQSVDSQSNNYSADSASHDSERVIKVEKKVSSITVFYDDNSFEVFVPQSKSSSEGKRR